MRVHLRADSCDERHTHFSVFVNGAHCGQLCMTREEAIYFHHIIAFSQYRNPNDEFKSTGAWDLEEGDKK